MSDDIFSYVVGLLVYSGSLVPMLPTLSFSRLSRDRFRRNLWILISLTWVQGLCFWPYAFAVVTSKPDSVYRLYLPFITGGLMLVGATIYSVRECVDLCTLVTKREGKAVSCHRSPKKDGVRGA